MDSGGDTWVFGVLKKLTTKEQKFVDGVSKGIGHEKAAISAGYSPKSARTLAARLLQKVEINTAIRKRREYFRSIADIEAKDIIGAQAEIAFASIEDALDDGGYLDFQKAKENGSAKLIKKISRTQNQFGENVAVEFYSRSEALGQLTDILGLKQMPRTNDTDLATLLKVIDARLSKEGVSESEIAEARARIISMAGEIKDEMGVH